jgi:hypothetical protein
MGRGRSREATQDGDPHPYPGAYPYDDPHASPTQPREPQDRRRPSVEKPTTQDTPCGNTQTPALPSLPPSTRHAPLPYRQPAETLPCHIHVLPSPTYG